MSTPIFKALTLVACIGLTGCSGAPNVTRAAPERMALPDGMVVAGGEGWCIDPKSSRAGLDASVVVLGSCAAITRNAFAGRPEVPGVVTISVERETGPVSSPEALQAFFATDRGRATLARNGDPGSIDILETRRVGSLLYLHAKDRSIPPDTSPDTWRALFALEGRFVSVSLYGLTDRPIPPRAGLAALEAQVDRLKDENAR